MRHYLFLHGQSALLALKRTARAPVASLLNLAMLSLALSLPVALYLVVQGVQQWSGKIDVTPELTVFMEMASEPADIATVAASLKQHPRVGQSSFVDKQQALAELETRSGVTGMAEGLDGNPLPDAFVVKPATLDAGELTALQKEIAGLPMVAEVQFDAAWAQKLSSLISLGGKLTLLLGSAFALALVLVTHNTIRMQILARRDEIEISKLIGATDNFIRRPFLYHALWQGVLAALAAWGLSSWLIAAANPVLADFARLYNEQLALRGLTPGELGALTALSALLAVSGARLATDHHLRQVRAH